MLQAVGIPQFVYSFIGGCIFALSPCFFCCGICHWKKRNVFISYLEENCFCHVAPPYLPFWGAAIPFSNAIASFYSPTSKVRGPQSLHFLTHACSRLSFRLELLWRVWRGISWFWFALSWRLKMPCILSCAYWQAVCFLWRMAVQVLCPF